MDEFVKKQKQIFTTYCLSKEMSIPTLPIIKKNKKLEAVLVEFRLLPHLGFILKNAIYKLGSEWSFTVICGNLNYHFFENLKKEIDRDIKIIHKNIDNITREEYSVMMLDSNFYKQFTGSKILIFQEDSIILSKLSNYFLQYDYIGAPFANKEVGNGGLSLRSKDIMIQICERFYDPIKDKIQRNLELLKEYKPKFEEKYGKDYLEKPGFYFFYVIERELLEDLQKTNIMRTKNIGKLAPFEIAKKFSIEKYYDQNPFGGHQFWYCINNIEEWLNVKLKY